MATGNPTTDTTPNSQSFRVNSYEPRHTTFPYTGRDFLRADESDDDDFYAQPRFVTHIDDHAIAVLKTYYAQNLPKQGRILDLCSSWVSHFPPELEEIAGASTRKGDESNKEVTLSNGGLEVVGAGMNEKELKANMILRRFILQNLNKEPTLPSSLGALDATTCVVSIDYLIRPVEVLSSIYNLTQEGGTVNLVVSNRCFPTKAVGRWLRVSEEERLRMVGDYLWFSGWRDIETVELSDGKGQGNVGGLMGMMGFQGRVDPLWVVRASKAAGGEAKREL